MVPFPSQPQKFVKPSAASIFVSISAVGANSSQITSSAFLFSIEGWEMVGGFSTMGKSTSPKVIDKIKM